MAQDYDLSQKQPSDEKADDLIIAEMGKMNFSLSQIAGTLSIFKALTIINLIIITLGAIIALALLPRLIHF